MSWVIATDSLHVREIININPIISYKFYLPLLCSAKEGRWQVSLQIRHEGKEKKKAFKTNKCKLTYFQTRVLKSSGF